MFFGKLVLPRLRKFPANFLAIIDWPRALINAFLGQQKKMFWICPKFGSPPGGGAELSKKFVFTEIVCGTLGISGSPPGGEGNFLEN